MRRTERPATAYLRSKFFIRSELQANVGTDQFVHAAHRGQISAFDDEDIDRAAGQAGRAASTDAARQRQFAIGLFRERSHDLDGDVMKKITLGKQSQFTSSRNSGVF